MRHARSLVFAAVAGLLAVAAAVDPARAAIIAVQVDDFEDGSLHNWQNGGVSNPNPAANVSTGGPAGANDNFMRLASNGSGAAGGKMVVFNTAQWTGNYLAAGVSSVDMQVNNLGTTDLVLRLIFVDAPAGQSVTTLTPVNVPAGSGWTSVSFSLAAANLTGGNANSVMDSVTELDLVHSPTPVVARGLSPNVVAQLGVDNVTATVVPEPGVVGMLAAAVAAAACRRPSRRGRRHARI